MCCMGWDGRDECIGCVGWDAGMHGRKCVMNAWDAWDVWDRCDECIGCVGYDA